MVAVHLDGITKTYRDVVAVNHVTLDVEEGEFVTLLGASGCGKTTCLRLIAGLLQPTRGRVFFDGRDVTDLPSYRRDTGVVFQNYALFPHLTVARNIAFGLKVRGISRQETEERVAEALRLVKLENFADRYPGQLSGGQKQRVALARAVVVKPKVLLLDEPLAALDLKLREELQSEIRRVQRELAITAVFVTHDQGEALSLSDRVAVMRDGRIEQIDTPARLYGKPQSAFVANFVGRTNFLDVIVADRRHDGTYAVALSGDPDRRFDVGGDQTHGFEQGESCLLAFRPEAAQFEQGPANALSAVADKVSYVGDSWLVTCKGPFSSSFAIRRATSQLIPAPDEPVDIHWAPESSLLFKKAS